MPYGDTFKISYRYDIFVIEKYHTKSERSIHLSENINLYFLNNEILKASFPT